MTVRPYSILQGKLPAEKENGGFRNAFQIMMAESDRLDLKTDLWSYCVSYLERRSVVLPFCCIYLFR